MDAAPAVSVRSSCSAVISSLPGECEKGEYRAANGDGDPSADDLHGQQHQR